MGSPSTMTDGGAIITDNNGEVKKPDDPTAPEAQSPTPAPEARSLDDIIKDIQENKPK